MAAASSRAKPCRISSISNLRKRPLEKLNKPFATVATDLNSGERVVFRTGDSGLAVRASAAVPGVFQPTQFRGHSYVDGGLTSPMPVQAAREMGADVVIAVDISDRPEGQPVEQPDRDPVADDDHHGRGHRRERTDAAPTSSSARSCRYVKSWDFTARHDAMLEGERAAQAALPAIRQKLGR